MNIIGRFLNYLLGRRKTTEKDRPAASPPVKTKVQEKKVSEIQREIDDAGRRIREIDDRLELLKKADPAATSRAFVKAINLQLIRTANLERQQSTMGAGLPSKAFKPRPAHEKKTWNMAEKPEEKKKVRRWARTR